MFSLFFFLFWRVVCGGVHVSAFAGRFTSQVQAVSGVSSACIVRVCARGCSSGEGGGECRGIKVLMLSVSLELRTNDEDDVDDVIGALWR